MDLQTPHAANEGGALAPCSARKSPGSAHASAQQGPTPLSSVSLEETAEQLAQLAPAEYDHVRSQVAARLGVRVSTLDGAVQTRRRKLAAAETGAGTALELPEPEPWPEPVDGTALLTETAEAIGRHSILPKEAATAIALWVVFAHVIDEFEHSPRLCINSPDMRCGKTTLLNTITRLVPRPLPTTNITAAALFRTVEKARPTLIIDEADSFMHGKDELRNVLNSGHNRVAPYVIRTVGENHEPRKFDTWCAAVVALIGKLPSTIMDRSIIIPMRRKLPHERVEPLRKPEAQHLAMLGRKIARWIADNRARLKDADPDIPQGLNDRAADNWRPLFAIADAIGGLWPGWARNAALRLSAREADDTRGTQLLADIREAFEAVETDRLTTEALIRDLVSREQRPWVDFDDGAPITPAQLSRLLEPYGIRPMTVRVGGTTAKGYKREDFTDAFNRYLPPQAVTPSQPQ